MQVSAKTGTGLDNLREKIDELLQQDPLQRVRMRIPQREGKALAAIEAGGRIFSRSYRDGSVQLDLQAPQSVIRRLEKFVVS